MGLPSRAERFAPWAAGAILALPVLAARYPPMADLPAHEAAVGLLRHWGDARYVPPRVYALNLGQPNQVFYFLILALASLVPIGTASALVVAGLVALLPVAAGRVADHLGVTRWAALLVAPIALGWMFFWGLVANLMGIGAYLLALPALDRFAARPSLRGAGAVTGWMILLHFVHDLTAIAAALSLVVLTACGWRGWRENAVRLAPAALVGALAALARVLEERHTRPGDAIVSMPSLLYRLTRLPDALFAGTGLVSGALLVLGALPVILFALERRGEESLGEASPLPAPTRFRFAILAAVFFGLYFVAPGTINWAANPWTGISQINERFLPLAWCSLAFAVAPRSGAAGSRLPRLLASLLPIAPVLVTWPEFAASHRAYRDLDQVITRMEPGSAHVLLELGPTPPDALFTPGSAGGHVVAVIGGRALFDYTRSPTAPVIQRPEAQWNEVLERLDRHPYRFVPEHDLRRFRYVILHTSDPGLGELARLALEPEARTVAHVGEFTLLESTLPLVPVDALDDPFPPPRGATLDQRAMAAAKRIGGDVLALAHRSVARVSGSRVLLVLARQ